MSIIPPGELLSEHTSVIVSCRMIAAPVALPAELRSSGADDVALGLALAQHQLDGDDPGVDRKPTGGAGPIGARVLTDFLVGRDRWSATLGLAVAIGTLQLLFLVLDVFNLRLHL